MMIHARKSLFVNQSTLILLNVEALRTTVVVDTCMSVNKEGKKHKTRAAAASLTK